jgi:hypothetical protein
VILEGTSELNQAPEGEREAVLATKDERTSVMGLPCAFCGHHHHKFGQDLDAVAQVQVSDTGWEDKRWGGGTPVWRCGRCRELERQVTLDARRIVKTTVPQATVADVKTMIGDSVFGIVRRTKWS